MQGNPVSMVTKSKIIITWSNSDAILSRDKVLELVQIFGKVQSLREIADENTSYKFCGYICEYYDIRAPPQAVIGLNGISIEVSLFSSN